MNETWGFVLAFATALVWGTYAVPFKISKSKNLSQFQMLTGVGIFISGLAMSAILGYPLKLNGYGLLSGILWGVANAVFLVSLSNLGISRAVSIVSSLVIISTFLWGALVFNELPKGLAMGFLGIATIISGVILISITQKSQSQNIRTGLITAVLSGLIWGSQLAPLKIGNLETKDFFFSVCFGIFITSALVAFIQKVRFKNEAIGMSFLSGVIWNIGNLLSVIAISFIGIAKAMPFTQASALAAVLWGIFYFKEIRKPKQIAQVLSGAVVLLIGIIILTKS